MRQDRDIRVGVDVGTRAVRVVVLRPGKGSDGGIAGPVEVLGAGLAESRGVVDGEVLDPRQASRAVREAAEEAERTAGVRITHAILGASGGRAETRAVNARVQLEGGRVEPWDPERVRSELRRASRAPGRQRLFDQIAWFRVERKGWEVQEASDPVGLEGSSLLASAVALETDAVPLAALAAAGRRAGLEVRALGWTPLASALATTTAKEREKGVVCLDLGAGALGLVYFADERMRFASGRGPRVDGDEPWRWLRESLGRFLGSGILPRDLMPAGLVLSGGGSLRPDAVRSADAELGLCAKTGRPEIAGALPGAASEWAGAVGLARLLEATDALRRRTDTTRVTGVRILPIAARLEKEGGAERLAAEPRPASDQLETGIPFLDDHSARPVRGQLCLLAGEPWSGASALAQQIALHSALHRLEPTLVLTADRGFKRTVLDLAGIEARVDRYTLALGRARPSATERFVGALARLAEAPLWVLDADEDGVDDLDSLRGAARAIQAGLGRAPGGGELGLRLVVIDPVSALGPTVAFTGHSLRALARELDAVVLAVATTGCLRVADELSGIPAPHRVEELPKLGDLGDAADVLWLASRPGMLGQEDGDELTLRMAARPFGAGGSCVLVFDGNLLRGPGLGEPPRARDAGRAERARQVMVACEPWEGELQGLLARYPDGIDEAGLLADPALAAEDGDDWLAEGVRDALEKGYGAYLVNRVLVLRQEGRLVPVDLGRMDTLFGLPAEQAARQLFELGHGAEALREDGFDWMALARLLAGSVRSLMSWGDGRVSNGVWLVAAPRPAGVLGLVFELGSGRLNAEPPPGPERLLRPEGYAEATLEPADESGFVQVEPAGARLHPAKLGGVLAVLGASVADLGQVKVLCRRPQDAVLFELGGAVRAALMPVRG